MRDDASKMTDPQQLLSSKKPNHVERCIDDRQRAFEPMRIRVTIYSLEGIRRHDVESQQCTSQFHKMSQKRNTLKATTKAPTTAIISLRGQLVKTLVPSAPLSFHEPRRAEKSVRGIGSWQTNILGEETKSKDEMPPSTFELSRNMRRQYFHRDARIDQISHFLPEMVDLVVGVARGKDIFPLGVASIVVSGEEEGEKLLNIPIKSFMVKNEKMHKKGRQKKGLCFEGDAYWYSLDSNAFLRVGILAIPHHNYIPTTIEKPKSTKENDEEDMFIELNDENSLIAQFKETEQTETKNSPPEVLDEYASGCYMMFCGALGRWPESARPTPSLSSENKVMEAKVFSLRAMSDVSGSTVRWQMRQEQQYDI